MHIKFQLIRLCYLFIWWCVTKEGFIDSHFDVKVSNVFSVATGLIIFILLGAALPLKMLKIHQIFSKFYRDLLDVAVNNLESRSWAC